MKQRNIAVCIILTFVTCGIYGIVWFVQLTGDANEASNGQVDTTSGGMALLLTLVTCGIYGYYWAYKMGEKISVAKSQRNMPNDSNLSVTYLLLTIFGLSIVAYALMQNEMNKMAPAA